MILRQNFSYASASKNTWTVYLCLGQAGERQDRATKEPKRPKSPEAKKEKAPVDVETESIIKGILDGKRSFHEMYEEYDLEWNLASQGLEKLEEEERKARELEGQMSTLRQKRRRTYK